MIGLQAVADVFIFIGKPFFKILLFLIISAFAILLIIIKILRVIKLNLLTINDDINGILIKLKIHSLSILLPKERSSKKTSVVQRLFQKVVIIKIQRPQISRRFLVIFCSLVVMTTTIGTIFWTLILEDLPSPENLSNYEPETTTKIYDRNGVLLYKIFKDKNRTLVKYDELPRHVITATVAIEDNEFFSHHGISFKGIVRSAFKNFKENKLYGGSTITQQLIKNVLLSNEKTYIRKVKEALLAFEVEKRLDKDTILEMYLNEVSYGGTAYGIEEASNFYFGKSAKELSLAESALLAGIPKSPSNYSPFVGNSQLAKKRQLEVLDLMLTNGFITSSQHMEAANEKLIYANQKTKILAPHFVMYIKKYLEEKYGEDVVEKGGFSVITSLDHKIQIEAEKAVSEEIENLGQFKVSNGATIIANPSTGEILAMVGSKNYFDIENDGNVNAIFSLRPPGSTIKAVNYAYALSHGYLPSTLINDSPITFALSYGEPYTPRNYDAKFVGTLTLRNAFAQSRNVPAVKVLNSYGADKMHGLGIEMGIYSWENLTDYGLSITLGGGNVTLFELAQSYGVLANYGSLVEFNPILTLKDRDGEIVEENKCAFPPSYKIAQEEGNNKFELVNPVQASHSAIAENPISYPQCDSKKVLDPRVAFIITDILRDNKARSPAFGSNSKLVIKGHPEVAVKTGTSNGPRDNLTVGYTKDFLVAVWVGNNDNSPMSGIASGVTGATPIFNTIMTDLLKDKSPSDWEIPNGLKKIATCNIITKQNPEGEEEKVIMKNEDYYFSENLPKNACSSPKISLTQNL